MEIAFAGTTHCSKAKTIIIIVIAEFTRQVKLVIEENMASRDCSNLLRMAIISMEKLFHDFRDATLYMHVDLRSFKGSQCRSMEMILITSLRWG